MKAYRRVYAGIDLDAAVFNVRLMKSRLAPGTRMLAVIKADGYGHGAVPMAAALGGLVDGYAVAAAEEALQLRRHGAKKPVLVLGPVHESFCRIMVEQQIRPCVFTAGQARGFSRAALSLGQEALIHLAVDTGMGRIGLPCDESGVALACEIARLPGVRIEGLFTHFARADEADKEPARRQLARYLAFADSLKKRGVSVKIRHAANSAAILELPEAHLDLVRAGISMYGLYPSGDVQKNGAPLMPVMSLKSCLTYIKEVPAGTQISYGGTFTADRAMRVATIPVGYGDGYPRALSGRGSVLIAGKRAPVLGRVCMDQFMVDVSAIPEADIQTEAVLLGESGKERITAEELGALSGRFNYELVCDFGKRIPRVYSKNGQAVGSKDWFDDVYPDFRIDDSGLLC